MQRRWRAAALFGLASVTAGTGLLALAESDRPDLVTWATDEARLRQLLAGGVLWALVCAGAAVDVVAAEWDRLASSRTSRSLVLACSALVVAVALLPGSSLAWWSVRQDAALDRVFITPSAGPALPSPLEELGVESTQDPSPPTTAPVVSTSPATSGISTTDHTMATPATTVPTPDTTAAVTDTTAAAPETAAATPDTTAAPVVEPGSGRWTIALLGGDAGPDRWGLRTDTMIVVSIDRATGDVASVSVPRNLERLPLPAGPLRRTFPRCFDDLANALYPYVATHPSLGLDPAQGVKGALAELLGIPIDHYLLVDMAGFVRIVDALGGVTLELSMRVPLVPDIDGSAPAAPAVGPGTVHLDGELALSFARSRTLDSDYGRMHRQRCLLASLVREVSPADLLRSYPALLDALADAFRTDIPREQLGELVELFAKVDLGRLRSVTLVPPLLNPAAPNVAKVRSIVRSLLDPTVAAPVAVVTAPTC
jgi:LCP family protein required for cell wall assembly